MGVFREVTQRYLSGYGQISVNFFRESPKQPSMKLPKTLLSAILIGITVQAAVSCAKAKESPDSKAKQESKQKSNPTDPCPACGMG